MRASCPSRAAFPTFLLCGLSALAACNSGNGGTNTATLRYRGDASAYGIIIRTGEAPRLARAAEADPPCTLSATAVAAGCQGDVQATEGGLRLTLRGCFVEDGDALFHCELSSAEFEQLRSEATVTAGCGCQPTCPQTPTVAVCDGDSGDCDEAVARETIVAAPPRAEVVSTTVQAAAETTCSTCCETDFADSSNLHLTADEPVTEIEVQVTVLESCSLSDARCEVEDYFAWGRRVNTYVSAGAERWCLSSIDPIEDPVAFPLLVCKEDTIQTIMVVRALGADFEPLATPPTVQMD